MDAQLEQIGTNLATIAKNDALKGLVPVLDTFLTGVQNNEAGKEGLVLLVNSLGPNLLAALPQVGAHAAKDGAAELQKDLDAAAQKSEGNAAGVADSNAGAAASPGSAEKTAR